MAGAIAGAPNLDAAVAATVQALQRSGITVVRGTTVVAPGARPRAVNRAQLFQAVQMANEARDREHAGVLTLRDLGRLLATAGAVPRAKADRFVVAWLNAWVKQARARPRSPHSFVPAFLAAMARRQLPSLDLARPFRAQDLRLTGLEWTLLLTAIDRGAQVEVPRLAGVDRSPSASLKPCTALDKEFEKHGFGIVPLPSGKVGLAPSDFLKEVFRDAVSKAAGSSDAGKVVGIVFKIGKILKRFETMMLFFQSATIRAFGQEGDSVHKGVGSTVLFHMSAVAGLNDEAQQQFEDAELMREPFYRALRDCAAAAGMPVIDDIQDVADGLDKWRVHWTDFGSTTLAVVNARESRFDYPGRQAHTLRRISDTEGAAVLAIDIQEERPDRHADPNAVLVIAPWGVTAELEASKPPDPKVIKSMIEGAIGQDALSKAGFGLTIADAIADILTNWTVQIAGPRDRGLVAVTEHVPCTERVARLIRLQALRQVGGPTCRELPATLYYEIVGGSGTSSFGVSISCANGGTDILHPVIDGWTVTGPNDPPQRAVVPTQGEGTGPSGTNARATLNYGAQHRTVAGTCRGDGSQCDPCEDVYEARTIDGYGAVTLERRGNTMTVSANGHGSLCWDASCGSVQRDYPLAMFLDIAPISVDLKFDQTFAESSPPPLVEDEDCPRGYECHQTSIV